MSLREKIIQEIRASGPISFSQYMEMCLYDAEYGYYSRTVEQFGKAGDFYTSSDVHAVFGRLLARQFEEMWRVLGSPEKIEILELGPGRGLFARDVLDWSEKKFPEFFGAVHYSLWERSEALRARLRTTLERHFAADKVSFAQRLKPLSSEKLYGTAEAVPSGVHIQDATTLSITPVIVFANELFDALPVEVLGPEGELRIAEKGGCFVETWVAASSENLEFVDRYGVHPENRERVETARVAEKLMSQLAAGIQRGFLVAVDYGYTRAEQLAGRHRGTVTAYRRHSVSGDPYEAPGEQDITAHVNFTALAAAAEQQGMQVQTLLTQSQFLMGIGEANQFGDAFEECRLPQEHAKVALQLKHLVTPAGMGESFHVLVASKAVAAEQVDRLSGLAFGTRNKK
ncbi:MAG TPA: SAM-dependent methyltransferase [Terriglobales bacterium]|nr:SAM-dependent methyltransferase [Terriglobales bacterium]